jgi:hypothetical protein
MEQFKPSETDFIGVIKKQMREFIQNSETLNKTQKEKLLKELGSNHYDERFSGEEFIEEAIHTAKTEWLDQNFELVDLWKSVVVNSANITETPQKVANEVVSSFKERFEPTDTIERYKNNTKQFVHAIQNGWLFNPMESIIKVIKTVNELILNKKTESEFIRIFHAEETKKFFSDTIHGGIEIKIQSFTVCSDVSIKVNIDYDQLTDSEYYSLTHKIKNCCI